ncbi:hypothetical protein [uncultured Methanolobus sp.]|uniref:hypothetical protein n=1 Tax=uncultured Methanolobus sp. TaxID=218300 RepID=UPI002AAB1A4D|nr:hypothetical protein [uncultured Methanolobus sp.]
MDKKIQLSVSVTTATIAASTHATSALIVLALICGVCIEIIYDITGVCIDATLPDSITICVGKDLPSAHLVYI